MPQTKLLLLNRADAVILIQHPEYKCCLLSDPDKCMVTQLQTRNVCGGLWMRSHLDRKKGSALVAVKPYKLLPQQARP